MVNLFEKSLNSETEGNFYKFTIICKGIEFNLFVNDIQLNSYFKDNISEINDFKEFVGMIDLQSKYIGLIISLIEEQYKIFK